MLRKLSLLSLLLCFILLMFNACKEEDTPPLPSIESISPVSGIAGTVVTITGTNFGVNLSDNTVQFNGVTATITAATATQLTVKAPATGGSGKVTIATSSGIGTGPEFTYKVAPTFVAEARVVDLSEAILGAKVNFAGTAAVTEFGIVYSTTEITSLDKGTKIKLTAPSGTGRSETKISGLVKGQNYYLKAYALIGDSTLLSDQVTFTTATINEWKRIMYITSGGFDESLTMGSVLNGKGYLTGGMNLTTGVAKIPLHEFDASTYEWNVLNNFPSYYRLDYTSFGIGDTLYLGWGKPVADQSAGIKEIWKYNVKSKTWKQGSDFPVLPIGVYAFTINGKGYALVGSALDDTGHNQLWEYTPSMGKWIKKASPPQFQFEFPNASFGTGGKGYVIASTSTMDGTKYYMWEYNPGNDTWTKKSEPPALYKGEPSVTTQNKIYIIHQVTGFEFHLVEYSADSDSWKDLGVCPRLGGGVALNNRLYYMWGSEVYVYPLQ